MITISFKDALWIAQRINRCRCVERSLKTNAWSKRELTIDYALSMRIDHKCPYIDFECIHGYPAIDCYECFSYNFDLSNNFPESKK